METGKFLFQKTGKTLFFETAEHGIIALRFKRRKV
jgi:hypothetical protein